MEAIHKEFNMTSSSLAVRIQDLPFNKDVQPLVIQDPLVQKFQKTMKQYPLGTEIDIFKQDPNDWRCQNMWNGCKKLRQLCISSKNRQVHGALSLHVDDLVITGDDVFEKEIMGRLRKDVQVGSEDKNDCLFVGQRI